MTTMLEQGLIDKQLPPELVRSRSEAEQWVNERPYDEIALTNLRQVRELIASYDIKISRKAFFAGATPPETLTKEEEDMVAGAVSRFGYITNPPPVLGTKQGTGVGD